MEAQSFEHEGVSYELAPVTDFQRGLAFAAMSDLCQLVTGAEWDDAPLMARRLIDYFISWNVNCTIDGTRWNIVQDATLDNYNAFVTAITTDDELASKWGAAYKAANMEQADPNAASVESD